MDPGSSILKLVQSLDAELDPSSQGSKYFRIDRFKQNVAFLSVEHELQSAIDTARLADFVIFLLSPTEEVGEQGESILRAVESQGVSNVLTLVQNLDLVEPAKKKAQTVTSLKSYITHFFPSQDKVYSIDSERECANVIRSLCTTTPKGIAWREERSWMLVEHVEWLQAKSAAHGEVVMTGVIRGKGMKADRLIQVGDWGTFQIEKITDATMPTGKRGKRDEMASSSEASNSAVLEQPGEDQEDLAELAPNEFTMEDIHDLAISERPTDRRGVLLDDHHYFSDDATHVPKPPKRLPKGTSSYQAAWFLGDMSDSGSDYEDVVEEGSDVLMDAPTLPQDGTEAFDKTALQEPTEATPSEDTQSELFLDPSPDEESAALADHRSRRKNEATEDWEYPDEIELHPNVLAKERLARYRGLKSLKTSHWETSEDKAYEPAEWHRLLLVENYSRAQKLATREALVGGIPPGRRVNVHVRAVPLALNREYNLSKPLSLCSLLRHEKKRTVVHFRITLSSTYPNSLKSKEPLVMQCGPRRFLVNPLYSQSGATPNNVHKYLRYLHPGQTAIATFVAPLTWGSVPAVFFQLPSPERGRYTSIGPVIATGTSLPPDRSRVVAKRVILTGHPYKIHKKLVTVRYMFFNAEDVNWFKALQLWTKRGRNGFIKESLGTHGYFKATFDGRINPMDAVGVSLYKRVWPRHARALTAGDTTAPEERKDDMMDVFTD